MREEGGEEKEEEQVDVSSNEVKLLSFLENKLDTHWL